MKRLSLTACIFALIFLSGCATSGDLKRTEEVLNQRIVSLKDENTSLKKELEGTKSSANSLQKNQADTGADIIDLRDNVQKLRGTVDELRKENSTLRSEIKAKDAKINEMSQRLNFLENFIGIGKSGPFSNLTGKSRPLMQVQQEEKTLSIRQPRRHLKTESMTIHAANFKGFLTFTPRLKILIMLNSG